MAEDPLLRAWLDGELDEAGEQRFRTWLADDRERLRQLLRAARLDSDLRQLAKGRVERDQAGVTRRRPRTSSHPRRWRRRRLPVALAVASAAAALIAIASLMMSPPADVRDPSALAHVERTGSAVRRERAGVTTAVHAGMGLAAGDRVVADEPVVLRWHDGTRIAAGPGTRLGLLPPDPGIAIRLDAGSLDAEVPPQLHALRITTPQARLRVLGTRFRVVFDAGATLLSVHEGRVELAAVDGSSPIAVAAGESARMPLGPAQPRERPALWRLDAAADPAGALRAGWDALKDARGLRARHMPAQSVNSGVPIFQITSAELGPLGLRFGKGSALRLNCTSETACSVSVTLVFVADDGQRWIGNSRAHVELPARAEREAVLVWKDFEPVSGGNADQLAAGRIARFSLVVGANDPGLVLHAIAIEQAGAP